ncbi:sensor histidine kinase [Candidatus Leptofilum sp.]|uniref:sensor histidine kinase n=1 Tax=Candidatus Leptofilum sp. TaxID=3241576 RepID=UPI003B5C664E
MRQKLWLGAGVPLVVGLLLALLFGQTRLANPTLFLRISLSTAVLLTGLTATILLAAAIGWHLHQQNQQAQAEKSLRATVAEDRRRFLQRLDHELKNPLMAMRAGLANVSNGQDEAAQQALASIEAQTVRLSQLTADLRKIAELETRPLELASVEMESLLLEVFELAQEHPSSEGRKLTLTVPQAPWPLPSVLGDRDLLFLAIYNLLENGLKYTAVPDAIELRAREEDNFVMVEVADTGPGIATADQPYIWEELYRGEAARGIPGSGLGLALVKAIVARHGGQVALSSRLGQGTLVILRLPIA